MLRPASIGLAAFGLVVGASGSAAIDRKPSPVPAQTLEQFLLSPATSERPPSPAVEPKPADVRPAPMPAAPALAAAPSPAKGKAIAAAPVPDPIKLSDSPTPTLAPSTFALLMRAADRYTEIVDAGGWPVLAPSVTLAKPGERSSALALLRQRLAASDDLPAESRAGDTFDATLSDAIKRFQNRHGIEETGLVGPRTLLALNIPAPVRLRQIQASAERLLGSNFAFGERYVVVNIPAAAVEAVQGGTVVRRYTAIAGKADRPSPSVATRITNVNFNPTWTAPVSVIKKDIIPHMRKDPGYLARMKIRIIDGTGTEIDPARIDWKTERAANYILRQDPGVDNSLGEIRFDMPNKHAVYMHDTPSKRLFARNARFLSSGCVRVAGVRDLAAWLLEGTASPGTEPPARAAPGTTPAPPVAMAPPVAGAAPGALNWGPAEIGAAISSAQRRDVKLVKAVPVAWVYLTGYATPDGIVHFRDDIYGLDTPGPTPAAAAAPAPAAMTVQPSGSPPAAQPPAGGQASRELDALVTSSIGRKP